MVKLIPLDHSLTLFTPELVREAIIKSGTSTACGPDDLNILHLRYLGTLSISYLTDLNNLSLDGSETPAVWKLSATSAILKSGKPPSMSTSYRPISLLFPSAKVLERLATLPDQCPPLGRVSTGIPSYAFYHLHATPSSPPGCGGFQPAKNPLPALWPLLSTFPRHSILCPMTSSSAVSFPPTSTLTSRGSCPLT